MNYLRYDRYTKCLYITNPKYNISENNKKFQNYTLNEVENDQDSYYVSFKNIDINEILVHDDVINVWEVKYEKYFAEFMTSRKERFKIERINIIDEQGMETWKIKIKHKFYNLYQKIIDYIKNKKITYQ
jgi:hypothetical protein